MICLTAQRLKNACLSVKLESIPQVITYLCLGREDLVHERHSLLLCGDHANNLLLLGELQLADALKALFQMRLYTQRVFGLGQNLKQLVVGQEEEPGGGRILCLVLDPPTPLRRPREWRRKNSVLDPLTSLRQIREDSNKNNAILTDPKNKKVSKHCKVSKYSNISTKKVFWG